MSLSCREVRSALLEQPPWDSRVERHTDSCAGCRELLERDLRVLEAASAWRDEGPAPPVALRARIESRLSSESDAASRPVASRGRLLWLGAAAAILVLSMGLAVRTLAPAGDGLEAALTRVAEAQKEYVEAIAGLEREASAVLARAGDPGTSPRQAAILIGYRDRLAHLDSVIAEVDGFLTDNAGHSGGHTVLLAAYKEKSEVLQEVLDLETGEV